MLAKRRFDVMLTATDLEAGHGVVCRFGRRPLLGGFVT